MRLWPRRRVYVDDLPQTHDGRFLLAFLLALVAALGAVYAIGYVVAGDTVPNGTTVAGIRIGGMSREEARVALEKQMSARLRQPIVLRAGPGRDDVVPADAGIAVDVDATLDAAMGGPDWDPGHMLAVVQGGSSVDPVLRLDTAKLAAALDLLARAVTVAPRDAQVTIATTRPVVHAGAVGQRLDVESASRPLLTAVAAGERVARARLTVVPPSLDVSVARAFAEKAVRPALRSPVTIVVAGHDVMVPAARFGPALRVDRAGDDLRLGVSADDLFARTAGLLASAPGRPVDAGFQFPGGRPVVVPGRPGTVVSRDAWAAAVLTAATSDPDRRVPAQTTSSAPEFTTADARALHIEAPVATVTRVVPRGGAGLLAAAVDRLDGAVVLPGADFSFITRVGRVGGSSALGPLSGATETAAESGAMTILERLAAPPFGHDLAFRNGGAYPVYIRSWLDLAPAPTVHVQLWASRAGF